MTTAYQIAILGGGPVGRVLALMLANELPDPARILLLQAHTHAPAASELSLNGSPASPSTRLLALNESSRALLHRLHAWPEPSAKIQTIHVSQVGYLGRTLVKHTDFGVEQLGNVVAYDTLQHQLSKRLAQVGVTLHNGSFACINSQNEKKVTVIQGEKQWDCDIAIQANGVGGLDFQRDYAQHAILTTAYASQSRPGWAWERFTNEGPLAVVPHPKGANLHSVVWCCTPERAQTLAGLDDTQFSQALTTAFGSRIGRLTSQTIRKIAPLHLRIKKNVANGRVVAIGNAAQTIHPVAGQGLNLGLRDAQQLTHIITSWLEAPQTNPSRLFTEFAQARTTDRRLTCTLTDLMPRIFTSRYTSIKHLYGLGLMGLDLSASIRAPLTRHFLYGFHT